MTYHLGDVLPFSAWWDQGLPLTARAFDLGVYSRSPVRQTSAQSSWTCPKLPPRCRAIRREQQTGFTVDFIKFVVTQIASNTVWRAGCSVSQRNGLTCFSERLCATLPANWPSDVHKYFALVFLGTLPAQNSRPSSPDNLWMCVCCCSVCLHLTTHDDDDDDDVCSGVCGSWDVSTSRRGWSVSEWQWWWWWCV